MNLMLRTADGCYRWGSALIACLGLLGSACAPNDISGTDGQSGFVSGGDHDAQDGGPDSGPPPTLAEPPDGGPSSRPAESPDSDPSPLLPESPDDGSPLLEQEGVPEVLHGELRPSSLRCVGDENDRELLPWPFQALLQRNGNTISGQLWALPALDATNVTGTAGRLSGDGLSFRELSVADYAGIAEFVLTDLVLGSNEITAVLDPSAVTLSWELSDSYEECIVEGTAVLSRDTTPPSAEVLEDIGGYSELIVGFDEPVQSDVVLDVRVDGESFSVTRADVEVTGTDGLIREMHLVTETPWPYGEITLVINGMSDVGGNAVDAAVPALSPEYEPANIDPGFELATRNGNPWWLAPFCSASIYEPNPNYGLLPTEGDAILRVYCEQNGLLFQQPIDVPAGATRLLIDVYAFLPLEMDLHLRSTTGEVELQLQGEVTHPEVETLQTFAAPLDAELGSALWLTAEIEFEHTDVTLDGSLYLDNLRFE
jgi:hypothetical protein